MDLERTVTGTSQVDKMLEMKILSQTVAASQPLWKEYNHKVQSQAASAEPVLLSYLSAMSCSLKHNLKQEIRKTLNLLCVVTAKLESGPEASQTFGWHPENNMRMENLSAVFISFNTLFNNTFQGFQGEWILRQPCLSLHHLWSCSS